MDETLWLKFTQHPDLKDLLLSTGGAELIMVWNAPHCKTMAHHASRTPVKTPIGD
jgi:predicted NAD-dependent protein-ADP-ribosyltransferase YbiA (DUF1768 family)